MENTPPLRVHVWDRCFLLQAKSFTLTKHSKPYRRPSATLIVASGKPFVLKTNHGVRRQYQGVLVAPYVLRQSIVAADSDLTIVDAGITSPAYQALHPRLTPQQVTELNADELSAVRNLLGPAIRERLSCAEARQLFDGVVQTVGHAPASAPPLDPQIADALEFIEQASLDELSGPFTGTVSRLSDSRLRTHFAETVGCSPLQYRSWVDAWRIIKSWKPGMPLDQLAQAAGIEDAALVEQAINELFGMSPAALFNSNRLSFHNCNLC